MCNILSGKLKCFVLRAQGAGESQQHVDFSGYLPILKRKIVVNVCDSITHGIDKEYHQKRLYKYVRNITKPKEGTVPLSG